MKIDHMDWCPWCEGNTVKNKECQKCDFKERRYTARPIKRKKIKDLTFPSIPEAERARLRRKIE